MNHSSHTRHFQTNQLSVCNHCKWMWLTWTQWEICLRDIPEIPIKITQVWPRKFKSKCDHTLWSCQWKLRQILHWIMWKSNKWCHIFSFRWTIPSGHIPCWSFKERVHSKKEILMSFQTCSYYLNGTQNLNYFRTYRHFLGEPLF